MGVLVTPTDLHGFRALARYAPRCDCWRRHYCEIVTHVKGNGAYAFRLECQGCRMVDLRDIGHRLLSPYEMANAEVRRIGEPQACEPCAHCGSAAGTELHHWAPRALFEDADEWPLSFLCRKCHMRWHRVMQTPHAGCSDQARGR